MNETPIGAVEMVRAIRDEIHEETKHLSREELKKFFEREAAVMRQESRGPGPAPQPGGESEAAEPPSAPGARARR